MSSLSTEGLPIGSIWKSKSITNPIFVFEKEPFEITSVLVEQNLMEVPPILKIYLSTQLTTGWWKGHLSEFYRDFIKL